MVLKVGILVVLYLVIKGVCIAVNENENIRFTIPKLIQRASLGCMAFASSQIMFF